MYIKLDYLYLLAFDLPVKATEISKYILFFSEKKMVCNEEEIIKF